MTVAVCAVALGMTIAFTDIVSLASHHLIAITNPDSSGDLGSESRTNTAKFQDADAMILPGSAIAYALAALERDGDAEVGNSVVRVDQEFVGLHCESCIKIEYNPYIEGKAGIAWKSAKPLSVEGAQRLVLWARGEFGGETVTFMILGKKAVEVSSIDEDRVFEDVDFGVTTKQVTLSSQFKMYQIDLRGLNSTESSGLTHLVAVQIDEGVGGRPVVVYLKGMLLDVNPPNEKFLLADEENLVEN